MKAIKSISGVVCFVVAASFLFLAEAKADILLNVKYIIPLTPEQNARLERFNDYTLYHYFVDMKVEGKEKVIFQLSPDLTGGNLEEVKLEVMKTEGDTRYLEGKKGEAKCEGPWEGMTCVFRFKNLNFASPRKAKEFFEMKYGPGEFAAGKTDLTAIFDNDPIGIGKSTPLDQLCTGCDAVNGAWDISMTNFSRWIRWYNLELFGSTGTFYSDSGKGELTEIAYSMDQMTAKWTADGRSGWLAVKVDGDRIDGTWGLEGSTNVEGRIWGGRP